MGDENPIRTLRDYSKPSHEGYRNTIELPVGNNVLAIGLNVFQQDLSPHGRILLPDSLLNSFHQAKLRNDILMFQQHHEESLFEAWTRFKDLLQKVPHHGIDRWLQIQFFYDHVSFHLKCEIDRAAGSKLRDKNAYESWEIIENLALYDHEGWNDTKEFFKLVKAISITQGISKMPNRILFELEDQINFLLKGSRPTPRRSTNIPHVYVDAVHSNPRSQNHNEPSKLNPFTFRERTGPSPQPQTLGATFEARVREYMEAHSERMERFENAIFKKREEINGRMTEMFGLLKELMTSRAPKKVLIREEAKFPVTKNVNTISLARGEEEMSDKTDETLDNTIKPTVTETEIPVMKAERSNETKNKPIKKAERKEVEEVLSSWPVEYYLKHRINEKLIEGLVDNNSIGGLKHVNALIDQGFDVNVMPYSTYMKLTNEMPTKTDIRLLLASHSYIYPLGIAEDVLVEVAEHVYPIDFVILDIKENEKMPFILGTPFLITAKAAIKFDKGTITLRSGKSKISFHMIPNSPGMTEKGVKNDIEPIAPTMTMNRLVLEWEEKIKLHLEREMKFNQYKGLKTKQKRNCRWQNEYDGTDPGGGWRQSEVTHGTWRVSYMVECVNSCQSWAID
ncbi:zinc finger, CCHC-type containing protein [Tanacetum coccineum]